MELIKILVSDILAVPGQQIGSSSQDRGKRFPSWTQLLLVENVVVTPF
jgi:hypothetical protein